MTGDEYFLGGFPKSPGNKRSLKRTEMTLDQNLLKNKRAIVFLSG